MIRRADELLVSKNENMRGGEGVVELKNIINSDEFYGKGRVFSQITLLPNTSIGLHQHVNEIEVFYIIKGEGLVDDNGKLSNVKAGDMIYTDNNQSHSIKNIGDSELVIIALVLFV